MARNRKDWQSSFSRTVRSLDIFGLPVKLNYGGQERIGTTLGAILTFIFSFLTILFLVR